MQSISKVILKGERYNNKVNIGNGIDIEIDPDFQPEEYANNEFEVVSAPKGVELSKGDKVVTMWWVAIDNPAEPSYSDYSFKGMYHATPNDIIAIRKGDELQGWGYHIFIEQVKNTLSSTSKELVLNFTTYTEPNIATVSITNPNFPQIHKGDKVIVNRYTPWALRIGQKEYFTAKMDGVVAIYKNNEILPLDDFIIIEPINEDIDLKQMGGLWLSRYDYQRFIGKDGKEFGRPVLRKDNRGRVKAIGKNVTQCKVGEVVVYHQRKDNMLLVDKAKYFYCFENELFVGIEE